MKRNIKTLSTIALAICATSAAASTYISDTKYDWSGLANSITSASKSDYEKAHDIYSWLTNNIAYDTSYSIHSADETYEQKRGVCQGYCELFCRLGEAVGLRSEIISGKSKDHDNKISDMGHAWIFAYTDGNSGILIDPTWGAGSVNNGTFTRNPGESWFNVRPEWLIYSHFPDEEPFQLISSPVSYDTFARLPYRDPALKAYGYDGASMLADDLAGKSPALPKFYTGMINKKASKIKVPLERDLRIGTPYEFYVLPTGNDNFILRNGDDYENKWQISGKQSAIRFTPAYPGKLIIGVEKPDGSYSYMIEYNVAQPTAQDIANLEQSDPLRSPALTSLENYSREEIESWGMDPRRILQTVKSENIRRLPQYYTKTGCRPVDIPLNGHLRAGTSYTFRFTPGTGSDFAAINNKEWSKEWTQNPDGTISLTVTPSAPGSLKISAKLDGTTYWTFLEYTVQ